MIPQFNLTSVRKRFGERVVLDVERLLLWSGRLYILTGPNGSGKSTLLSILAFLTKPDHGDLLFSGELVTWAADELSLLRKRVTLLHQFPYLFDGTVFGNVAYGLKVRGIRSEALRRSVDDSLELVGLNGFDERNVGQLSGGETRRVALARALVLNPDILLLDEPLANVDKESADLLERLIAFLPSNGTTVVMSTHDPHQGERLKGEVIRLLDGRVNGIGNYNDKEAQICPPMKMHAI
jgi:tungstate transport system ATP-binding protein